MSRPFWQACFTVSAWAALSLSAFGAEPESANPAIPEVLQRVIATYASDLHGVVGMQRHFTTLIDAGIAKHTEQSDSGLLLKDGAFETAHYYRIVRDGKEFSGKDLADRDKQTNEGWSAGKIFFKEPYDKRFVADYTFTMVTPCSDCSPGTVAIRFVSAKHDDQHGAGTMWLEPANERVVKLTYVPYVLPPHASSGTVTESTAQTLSNLWYVVRIEETYTGHALLLRGTGTFTGLIDHFQRFASLSEGESAVRDGTIGTVVDR